MAEIIKRKMDGTGDTQLTGDKRASGRRGKKRTREEMEAFHEAMEELVAGDEEAIEDNTPEGAVPTDANAITDVEKILFELETHPEDPQLKVLARRYIKNLFISNGGLPCNPNSPIPHDLEKFSSQELIHIIENMLLFSVKSKHDQLVSRAINIVSNVTQVAAITGGYDIGRPLVDELKNDGLLSTSFVEAFLGRSMQVNPLMSFFVSSLSHLSNFVVRYIDGKRAKVGDINERVLPPGQQPIYSGERQGQRAEGSPSAIVNLPNNEGNKPSV